MITNILCTLNFDWFFFYFLDLVVSLFYCTCIEILARRGPKCKLMYTTIKKIEFSGKLDIIWFTIFECSRWLVIRWFQFIFKCKSSSVVNAKNMVSLYHIFEDINVFSKWKDVRAHGKNDGLLWSRWQLVSIYTGQKFSPFLLFSTAQKQPGLSKAPHLLRLTKASVDELCNVVFSCSNLKLINRADVSGSMERSCRRVYERKLSNGLGGGECSSPGGSWSISVPVSVNQPHRPETRPHLAPFPLLNPPCNM